VQELQEGEFATALGDLAELSFVQVFAVRGMGRYGVLVV
jgi:hypothetical protein